MYSPRHFTETDLAGLDDLFAHDPFVTLVTRDHAGEPFASHLPVLYRRDGAQVVIEGHWARANPQSVDGEDALVIVHGPHAYISPGWYPDKHAAARVPTWNYAIAHLRGALQRSDDPIVLADLVSRLSARFEAEVGSDWHFDPQRREHAAQLRAIVAFRFEPVAIELKFKLGQNHPPANVVAAAAALDALGDEAPRTVARLMRDRLAHRPTD